MKELTIEERIAKVKNWLIKNSSMTPYVIGFGLRQWTEGVYKRYPEFILETFCGFHITQAGSVGGYLADEEEYYASFLKLMSDRSILDRIYADFLKAEDKYKKFIGLVKKEGEEYLHQNFDEFIRVYDAEYIPAVTINGVLIYGERFFNEMKEKYPYCSEELRILAEQYGETFINRYRQELLKLALRLIDTKFSSTSDLLANKEIKSALENIQQEYHWIKNNYKNISALPVSFFAEQLFEVLADIKTDHKAEIETLSDFAANHKKACNQIKKQAIFDPDDYEKVLWLGKIGWWVDRRKEYNLLANYYLGRHLEFVCDKQHLNYEDAIMLLPWELDEIISGKKTIEDFAVNERKEEFIYFRDIFGQEMCLAGSKAGALYKKISPPLATGETNEIKGMVAFKGKVTGVARVVMDAHNPGEFNDGDILITGMTRPDYLSLMKKSAAFVTDEGGITCHAAIVARELKKPCVIGTKVATQIFKSGDMVEVDADKGVVRVVNKGK